jgi:hypothetical protein
MTIDIENKGRTIKSVIGASAAAASPRSSTPSTPST